METPYLCNSPMRWWVVGSLDSESNKRRQWCYWQHLSVLINSKQNRTNESSVTLQTFYLIRSRFALIRLLRACLSLANKQTTNQPSHHTTHHSGSGSVRFGPAFELHPNNGIDCKWQTLQLIIYSPDVKANWLNPDKTTGGSSTTTSSVSVQFCLRCRTSLDRTVCEFQGKRTSSDKHIS